jgi:hypothetical protein
VRTQQSSARHRSVCVLHCRHLSASYAEKALIGEAKVFRASHRAQLVVLPQLAWYLRTFGGTTVEEQRKADRGAVRNSFCSILASLNVSREPAAVHDSSAGAWDSDRTERSPEGDAESRAARCSASAASAEEHLHGNRCHSMTCLATYCKLSPSHPAQRHPRDSTCMVKPLHLLRQLRVVVP